MNFDSFACEASCFRGKFALSFGGNFCHAVAMPKIKQLLDIYRFPGFVPLPHLRGIFGDRLAVLISLKRRRKKRCAAFVARRIGLTTTNARDGSAIFRVATNESIFPFGSGACPAPGVAR